MTTLDSENTTFYRPSGTHFDPETGFLLVVINKDQYGFIDQEVQYGGKVFQPKSELHITIISQDAAERVRKQIEEHPEDNGRILEIIGHTNWSYRPLNEFYHVEEEPGVETIIEMVEVPNLSEFFRDLTAITGGGFILPPTHVTLYTRGTETGIGLPTREVFDSLVRARVNPDELHISKPR